MMVYFGISQVGEGLDSKLMQGIMNRHLAISNLLQKMLYIIGIHQAPSFLA